MLDIALECLIIALVLKEFSSRTDKACRGEYNKATSNLYMMNFEKSMLTKRSQLLKTPCYTTALHGLSTQAKSTKSRLVAARGRRVGRARDKYRVPDFFRKEENIQT